MFCLLDEYFCAALTENIADRLCLLFSFDTIKKAKKKLFNVYNDKNLSMDPSDVKGKRVQVLSYYINFTTKIISLQIGIH